MERAIPTDFEINPTIKGGFEGAYEAGAAAYPAGGNVTQNISITSRKALSEKEAAREFRNMSRKLALGVA
jgi:hypothetical protein